MGNTTRNLLVTIWVLFLLLFAVLFIANINVFADSEIEYLKYNTSTKVFETQTISSYTPIESTTDFSSGGTFVLADDVEVTSIDCGTNNLTLILCDGKTLTVGGIKCKDLTIYAQELGTGKIVAKDNITSGNFIKSSNYLYMHGGEISTGAYSVEKLVESTRDLNIYSGKFKGNVKVGLSSRNNNVVIESAIVDFSIISNESAYGISARQNVTINNGVYDIKGLDAGYGTAICSTHTGTDVGLVTIENGTFSFNNVEYGFLANQELTINHGKINITSTNNAFKSRNKTIFIQGTVTAHSEEYPVAHASKTISVSYASMLCTTNSTTRGVFYSESVSMYTANADYYYKDNEDGQWYQDSGKGPNSPSVKYLKVVPLYNHITVWVEDITVEEGTDISSMIISYGFGYYEKRDEETLEDYADVFEAAAKLFTVTVNCDGTIPGTYDYVLSFNPEYEGNIDDHYDIIFGDEIGHFKVTALPPEPTSDLVPDPDSTPDPGPEQQESQEQSNETPAPSPDIQQDDTEESSICIGLVVIFIDVGVFLIFVLVLLYLLLNKKGSSDNSVRIAHIARIIGLLISICVLIFAIVVIASHQCAFAIGGIVWAAINVALFGISYIIREKE